MSAILSSLLLSERFSVKTSGLLSAVSEVGLTLLPVWSSISSCSILNASNIEGEGRLGISGADAMGDGDLDLDVYPDPGCELTKSEAGLEL